ncbi:LuxR family transcriptional regulator [Mycolicibacterium sp. NCC-Tsukiji]|uniref:LuxR C-terminal-related transcriptional regulator n=1 Tax=Mycolicibacterium sp. NCC-Tsukiji TaxID=2185272 RepID=UPI00107F2A3E
MSELRAGTPLVDWSDVGVSELPTGTVTLLLADVEGSTQLWETQPDMMAAAIARLDETVSAAVVTHAGVRPVEQGEGDSFVIAFGCASDAVACALELQRAPLAPIRLRIGIHTGEVRLRDAGNYIGPTINRTARLRDLGHGGQTLLSGVTAALTEDQLPDDASLTDLGTHAIRDLPRPERVAQLCHPDLRNEFPPLRTPSSVVVHGLPVQLTNFIGRETETANLRDALAGNRLVTLTGAGGAGKTRLAVHVVGQVVRDYDNGVWYVDLAPVTNPDAVPATAARALGLSDQPGRSTMDTLLRYVRDHRSLIVLDNCEHVLDASAALVGSLLGAAPYVTVLATSREPLGVAGEAVWQVPSLSLADEAVELFADRARLARTDFTVTDHNATAVVEICRRLDGMPLAIEFAAARVRALSLAEIRDSLHDRFRLLTGSARTAVRRQQTLRASVDWSHALLSEPERVLFRRLAVFLGGFDLEAARAVAAADVAERYQVLDQLSLLVDKSLVVAENAGDPTRYRMLETVRQYALEKLAESGEGDTVRARHRDHYATMASQLDTPRSLWGKERRFDDIERDIDNVRAAFEWSHENHDIEIAGTIASSLQPMWLNGGRIREGLAWFGCILSEQNTPLLQTVPAVHARALTDMAMLGAWAGIPSKDGAEAALRIAREVDDPAILARTLTTRGFIAGNAENPGAARPYFTEAVALARALGDQWMLRHILLWQAQGAAVAGDPATSLAAAEEVRAIAEALGDEASWRDWRQNLGWALLMQGDVAGAVAQFRVGIADAEEAHDPIWTVAGLQGLSFALAYQGAAAEARSAAEAAIAVGAEFGDVILGLGHSALVLAALAAGDAGAAQEAGRLAWRSLSVQPATAVTLLCRNAEAALAAGDLVEARRLADAAVAGNIGWHRMMACTARARVEIVDGQGERAERDAHDALACAVDTGGNAGVPDILECLGHTAASDGRYQAAARFYAAAEAISGRIGVVRLKVYQASYEASVAALREAMGETEFDAAWAEGAGLSTEEAIAYAQRGRGERGRPATGWASLTPAEREVVKLVCEGLGNKDIAARLFVSPRTVQAHLTHVYTKLGFSSRIQLIQDTGRQHRGVAE